MGKSLVPPGTGCTPAPAGDNADTQVVDVTSKTSVVPTHVPDPVPSPNTDVAEKRKRYQNKPNKHTQETKEMGEQFTESEEDEVRSGRVSIRTVVSAL